MTNLPSLIDLMYFSEIAKTLNLTRAAESLGITQPTLSLSLKRIESDLKSILVIREKSGIKLTREGQTLFEQSDALLQQWKNIQSKVLNESGSMSGLLSIGCHTSVARYVLPNAIQTFTAQNKDVEIRLEHDLSRKILDQLVTNKLDCAIVMNPIHHPNLILTKILEDEVGLYQVSKTNIPEMLIYDPNLFQSQAILKKIKKNHFKRHLYSTSLEVIARLVHSGCGAGILPARVANLLNQPKLIHIENTPTVTDHLYFAYRVEDRKTQKILSFKQHILDSL